MFLDDLSVFYADFGEPVTVAGSPVTAIFDGGYAESLDVSGTRPTLRCRAVDVVAVPVGAAVVRAGTNFVVREKLPIAPDESETYLVLERS